MKVAYHRVFNEFFAIGCDLLTLRPALLYMSMLLDLRRVKKSPQDCKYGGALCLYYWLP